MTRWHAGVACYRPMPTTFTLPGNGLHHSPARGFVMHLVTAVVPPHRLDDVHAALGGFGVLGMTISQVTGFGIELWTTEVYRGQEFHDESTSNVRIEVIVAEGDADDVVEVVRRAAASASSGAGKIWVVPVDLLVRIRTGERGSDAL